MAVNDLDAPQDAMAALLHRTVEESHVAVAV